MADVAFKDLSFDANRPEAVGRFWAGILGYSLEVRDDGDAVLRGPTAAHTIWVARVPETQDVKNRAHVDVRFDDAIAVPGTVVREAGEDPWRVLADPDAIAQWWGSRFGVPVQSREGQPYRWLENVPGSPYPYWVFNPVPEPKTVKNRVHWDVTLVDASLDDVFAAGATLVRAKDDEIRWTVLADPEGNEFCAFAAD